MKRNAWLVEVTIVLVIILTVLYVVGVRQESLPTPIVVCPDKSGQARFYSELDSGTYIVHVVLAEPKSSAIFKKLVGDSSSMYEWLFVSDIPPNQFKVGTVVNVGDRRQK